MENDVLIENRATVAGDDGSYLIKLDSTGR
jgi:hypothetical protein